MSVELYLAVNLFADLALLGGVSRALGMFNGRRVSLAAGLCAAYAALAAAHPNPWARAYIQVALAAAAALIVVGRTAFQLWSKTLLSMLCAALLCGGLAVATGLSGPAAMPACVGASLLLTGLLYFLRPPLREGWQVWLTLTVGDRTTRFPALIDTGNRLREPRSGLPVVIAEASLVKDVLPEDGYRVLRFGAVGGEGCMACFKPSAVWIERGRRKRQAPEVWVATSPDPLPGLYRALAPPEFALYRL